MQIGVHQILEINSKCRGSERNKEDQLSDSVESKKKIE